MQNAIYTGYVKHKRFSPTRHSFSYRISLFFINLSQLDEIGNTSPILSVNRFNLLSLQGKNYLPSYSGCLLDRVKSALQDCGEDFSPEKVYLLTNLSYLGFCYNPVSFYYCYDSDKELRHILAEVNNTPWNERFIYSLKCVPTIQKHKFITKKSFHISPFLPMSMEYRWYVCNPSNNLTIHIKTFEQSLASFSATMSLKRCAFSKNNILKSFVTYPLMSQKVLFSIYLQAFKMWLKRFPFFQHPEKINAK